MPMHPLSWPSASSARRWCKSGGRAGGWVARTIDGRRDNTRLHCPQAVMKILKKGRKAGAVTPERATHLQKFLVSCQFFKAMNAEAGNSDEHDDFAKFDETLSHAYRNVRVCVRLCVVV